jgi:hypothetical protein
MSSGSLAAMERNALPWRHIPGWFNPSSSIHGSIVNRAVPFGPFRISSAQATVAFDRRFGKFLETGFGGF